jgi:hypothetical protein
VKLSKNPRFKQNKLKNRSVIVFEILHTIFSLHFSQERIRLKYKITYNMDSETHSDMGEVDNFVFT